MKEIIYEHDNGVEILPKELKHKLKKEQLRVAMGWTKQELDDHINNMKQMFESNKKEILNDLRNQRGHAALMAEQHNKLS